MVCGCSPRMNFDSCCGLAFSSDAKPAVDAERLDDPVDDPAGHVGPERLRSAAAAHVRRRRRASSCAAEASCWNSSSTCSPVSAGTVPSTATSRAMRSISSSCRNLKTLPERSSPSAIMMMAALRRQDQRCVRRGRSGSSSFGDPGAASAGDVSRAPSSAQLRRRCGSAR